MTSSVSLTQLVLTIESLGNIAQHQIKPTTNIQDWKGKGVRGVLFAENLSVQIASRVNNLLFRMWKTASPLSFETLYSRGH